MGRQRQIGGRTETERQRGGGGGSRGEREREMWGRQTVMNSQ